MLLEILLSPACENGFLCYKTYEKPRFKGFS